MTEIADTKGTAYLQGLSGFNYLAKEVSSLSKPMKTLKDYLQDKVGQRKTLYLKFNDGELEEAIKGVYQLKINPSDKNFLNDLRDVLEDKGEVVDRQKTKPGQTVTFKSGFQLYLSGRTLSNVFDETGNPLTKTSPKTEQQEDGFLINLKEGKMLKHLVINKKIGFNFDKDWYHSFLKSYEVFTSKIISERDLSDYDFYRDSDKSKLDLLNKITDTNILPSAKDNWNPSDIWCIKKKEINRLTKQIDALYKQLQNKNVSIERLNKFIEIELKNKNLIGVSLKQVTSKKATVEMITKDAKYIDSVKFKRYGSKMNFDVTKSYFDVNVKMQCLKNDELDYFFRFRPRGSSSALTQNAEGRLEGSGPADGAVDKKNLISVLFPGADDITKADFGKAKTIQGALDNINKKNKTYNNLYKWVKKGSYKFVNIDGLTNSIDEQSIKRGLLNLNYVYLIDSYSDQKELFKKFYLSSKKVNAFSSIHYKIYG